MSKNIKFDGNSLIINGKREILIGGEFHYFRTPNQLWEKRIKAVRQSGCNLVATYIPWNFHEQEEGNLIWDGDRNLAAFIELCNKYKLYVILKPGPYICAEWDFGGFPHWLLDKGLTLRTSDKKYLSLVEKWYKDVATVIKPHLVTNGGNVVLVQIENEYDHLLDEMPEITGSEEDAKNYLLKLLDITRRSGIDVPAFTNEGACILGTEIINTHTYYPNIPWIWMWEFNDFDRKIEESRQLQPDKPLMILELEAGWFAQFGKPLYEVSVEAVEAITKTVLAYGASVLNYYMLVGGTTFPHWISKGDYGGIGTCTSFDFGGSPIREWGELHKKYHLIRNMAYFLKSFPEVIISGKLDKEDGSFISGSQDIAVLYKDKTFTKPDFENSFENVKLILRRGERHSVLLVRNLEDEDKSIRVKLFSRVLDKEICIPANEDMRMIPKSSLLMPVDFTVSEEIRIICSTSEIILKKQLGDKTYVFLKGAKDVKGEMLLQAKRNIEIVSSEICSTASDGLFLLEYSHSARNVFRAGQTVFIILPENDAQKFWMDEDFVVMTDNYYLEDVSCSGGRFKLVFQMRENDDRKTYLWLADSVKEINVNGKNVKVEKDEILGAYVFDCDFEWFEKAEAGFTGKWKYQPDAEEREPDFDDSGWASISADAPLEKSGYLKHGYFWYRTYFDIDGECSDLNLKLNTNEMDRITVYINGKFTWIGIGSPDLDITMHVKSGKNTLAILYTNEFHTKAHPHEGPIQKVSGLYCPVEIRGTVDGSKYKHTVKGWKLQFGLLGDKKEYFKEDFNDKSWIEAPESKKYVVQEEISNIVWFRRKFRYKRPGDVEAPLYIKINSLRDRCLIYVNGFPIGKYESIGPQDKFFIPENILKEENNLAIVIEGPGFHPVKGFGFLPPKFKELELGFYFQSRAISVTVKK